MRDKTTRENHITESGLTAIRDSYGVVVVGARAAGSAAGMLLARAGLQVLVLDRGAYGSDTLSTHALMRAGVLQLQRWGLLDRIKSAGTPPIHRTTFDLGKGTLEVEIKPKHGVDALYAPRRTVLDRILADAAREAGADIRFGVTVDGLVRDTTGRVTGITVHDRSGRAGTVRGGTIVGADGMQSPVARAVRAPVLRQGRGATAAVYGYWSGLDFGDAYHWIYRPGASAGVIPTNGGAVVFAGTTPQRFRESVRPDVADGFREIIAATSPEVAELLRTGQHEGRYRSFPGRPGFMRQAHGPGWALVGDAGYFKDPMTAHGISDALRDAEFLARAICAVADGADEYESMQHYQATRDALSLDLFEVADELAAAEWTDMEIGGLLERMSAGMRDEVDALAGLDDLGAAA